MNWICTAAIVFSIAVVLEWVVRQKRNRKLRPPSPRGLPILGHLHLLGKNPHQDLDKLSKKHGDIMYMKFGFVPTIIVSSPEAAELFLKTYDHVFASRPSMMAPKYLSYENATFIFAPYGPYWRKIRKLCSLELLTNQKTNSYQSMRKEEVALLVETLKSSTQVDLSAKISSLSADMSCRMIFGNKYKDEDLNQRGFRALTQEGMEVLAIPNLGDFFPYLGALNIQGLKQRITAVFNVFDAFVEKIIDEHEHLSENTGQTKDFVATLLAIMKSGEAEFEFDRRHIKIVMLDMLSASMDTSSAVIEWTMSELLRNPQILKKVQAELEKVVGMNRIVEEADLDSLEYLDMVVKESLRLHPVAPLLLPHESMEDCIVNGFNIPKKSRIIINVWAIGRDPSVWSDPEKYIPERFMGSNVDVRGRDFQLIPFGSGRRGCPGMQLGLTIVRLVVAQLSHCFDWNLPYESSDLDMTEHFGLVVSRAKHLTAIPSYRLNA